MNAIQSFADSAKFKVSRCTKYRYFNIDADTQIRIVATGGKHSRAYRTLLIHADEDGIFMATSAIKNEHGSTLADAKTNAGKIYFNYLGK
jgi:hypothetical protein